MASGYTYKIKEGKTTLREFALDCAKCFGACISLRDEPNATIPDEFVPGSYHEDNIKKARRELIKAQNMTLEKAEREAEQQYKYSMAEFNRRKKENNQTRRNYESMLEKVKTWEPPTPNHEGLKKLMISQLEESIKYDCPSDFHREQSKKQTGEQYKSSLIREAQRDIKYHTQKWNKEVRITKERTEWVRALRNSLPKK